MKKLLLMLCLFATAANAQLIEIRRAGGSVGGMAFNPTNLTLYGTTVIDGTVAVKTVGYLQFSDYTNSIYAGSSYILRVDSDGTVIPFGGLQVSDLGTLTNNGDFVNVGSFAFPNLTAGKVLVLNPSGLLDVGTVDYDDVGSDTILRGPWIPVGASNDVDLADGPRQYIVLSNDTAITLKNTNLYSGLTLHVRTDGGGPYAFYTPPVDDKLDGQTISTNIANGESLFVWVGRINGLMASLVNGTATVEGVISTGTDGQILISSNGVSLWATVSTSGTGPYIGTASGSVGTNTFIYQATNSSIFLRALAFTGTNNIFTILDSGGTSRFKVNSNGVVVLGSNLLFSADNLYDIGAGGATRPKDLYLAGAASVIGNALVGGSLITTNDATFFDAVIYTPLSRSWASVFQFNFSSNALQEMIVTNAFTLSATNYLAGAVGAIRLRPVNYASNYTVTIDASFNRYGSNLTASSFVLASNKNAVVSLTSWGTHATNAAVAVRSQQ